MMNRELTAVINTLITVGGAFTFGFYGIQLAYPSWSADVATKVLVGLVLATLVFFADLYFLVKNMDLELQREDQAQKQAKSVYKGTISTSKKKL